MSVDECCAFQTNKTNVGLGYVGYLPSHPDALTMPPKIAIRFGSHPCFAWMSEVSKRLPIASDSLMTWSRIIHQRLRLSCLCSGDDACRIPTKVS